MDGNTIKETLKQYYEAFANQPRPLAFFSGISDYVDYILETPELKAAADAVTQEKEDMFNELDRLENAAIEEMETSKKKILKIIKDNYIDPATLQSPFNLSDAPNHARDPLERMWQFDEKELAISGFKSDVISSFLFDIAASIARSGRGDLVREFEVANSTYGHHYDKLEDDDAYRAAGKIRGNFVFSKTIIKRIQQQVLIDRSGDYGLWNAFNDLFKLHESYELRSKGFSPQNVTTKYLTGPSGRNGLENSEIVDKICIFNDLETLANSDEFGKSIPASRWRDLQYLDEEKYKGHAARVHAYLLKELGKMGSKKAGMKMTKEIMLFLASNGDLYRDPRKKYQYPMDEGSDRYKIVRYLVEHKGYQSTPSISSALDGKAEKSIRTEIGKIRANIKKLLKIEGKRVIGGKKESGYRIEPGCRITFKDQ